jgi:hypothetical protein
MNKIYWIASYPKSGNTWVRIFLTNYLMEGDEPADINHLKGGPIASDRDVFDRWAGAEASDLPAEEVANLRPEVYRQMALHIEHPLYMKVHDACTRNGEGAMLFPPDVTAGVLYIIRNPLDVAVSYAHHGGRSVQKSVEGLCKPDGNVYESSDRLPFQLPQRLLSWSGHVRSWVDESGMRVTVVRYEDLLRQPGEEFERVLQALDLEPDAGRLSKAMAFSRFDDIQDQERKSGFKEKRLKADAPFFREGRAGTWRAEMPPELAERILATQAEIMRRFGYLDENSQPVF